MKVWEARLVGTFTGGNKIYLDNNNISKRGLAALGEGLIYNNSISLISLNHNKMNDDHALLIADLIRYSTIRMLFIAWNKIRDRGGVLIFNALAVNPTVQILDASFNSFSSSTIHNYGNSDFAPSQEIGGEKCGKTAIALNKMFGMNSTLIHVDLSHNSFSVFDGAEISKGLNQNKSVLGLHMSGNSRDTNALGFIEKMPNYDPGLVHVHTRIHESLETGVLSEK